MRVLIIGGTGLLGRVLLEEWAADEIAGITSRDADIRDLSGLRAHFTRLQPDCTVLAAAYTDVDGCERDPDRAHDVNCTGAANVASACREVGSRLLFLSTDYVFDGSQRVPYEIHDETNPLNIYGRSKAEAEKLVQEILPSACILRTSWLFGVNGRCFPNTILEAAKTRKKLSVVDDQIGRPTYNRDLARAIIELSRIGARGIVQAANSGSCSWHEFACHLLRVAGFADVSVAAIRTDELARPARRPAYSVLSLTSLEAHGVQMQPWQDAAADYVRERTDSRTSRQPIAPPIARTA